MPDSILCGDCASTFATFEERDSHDCVPFAPPPAVEEPVIIEAPVVDDIAIVNNDGGIIQQGMVNYVIPAGSELSAPVADELDRILDSKGLQHADTWSDYGQYLFNHIVNKCPHNPTIAAVGHAGMGKTRFFQAVARA